MVVLPESEPEKSLLDSKLRKPVMAAGSAIYLLLGTGVVVASLGVIGSRYLERRDRRIGERQARKDVASQDGG